MKSVGAIGAALAAASLSAAAAQYGPGSGPWEVTTPEAEGLSTAALRAADEAVESGMGGRVCYVVVKNGKIVHERYMGSGTEDGIRSSWSATKSMCASLYGIAVQEGWADVNDKVGDRNEGTRLCNADAEFRHVLTMTGTSPDIQSPQYSYDTLGTNCLDTLQDFIMQNNPDGLTTSDWMQVPSSLSLPHSHPANEPNHTPRSPPFAVRSRPRAARFCPVAAAEILRAARHRALAVAAGGRRPAVRLLRRHLLPRSGQDGSALGQPGLFFGTAFPFGTAFHVPFTAFLLSFLDLFTAFHCLFTVFPWPSTAFSLSFLGLTTAFSLSFLDLPGRVAGRPGRSG